MKILGISAFYHDSACALIDNGTILGAVQEEAYTRQKHDPSFPTNSIKFCLAKVNSDYAKALEQIDYIVFYDKPLLKFERSMETYLEYAPWKGMRSFIHAFREWGQGKFNMARLIRRQIKKNLAIKTKLIPPILFNYHHASHAGSAFYPSPYQKGAILCLDGVGEWATTSLWSGDGETLTPLWQINFPHSIGLFYSTITEYCGFKVNSGEYKLMGLASYGKPQLLDLFKEKIIEIKEDGSFRLNMEYFNYPHGQRMASPALDELLNRHKKGDLMLHQMDVASSAQKIVEEVVIKLCNTLHKETGLDNLCMAGGVALNCVANSKIISQTPFRSLWIQPASGDAGGAVGAAYCVYHQFLHRPRKKKAVDNFFLGPSYGDKEVRQVLDSVRATHDYLAEEELVEAIVSALEAGLVVGHFNGPLEFGPRALGNRSILADPRPKNMQEKLNQKIKRRESFRPFALSVLEEHCPDIFGPVTSPYMLLTFSVLPKWRKNSEALERAIGKDKLKIVKSPWPSCTHVDYSCRLQTVSPESPLRLRKILHLFYHRTKCQGLINTSFNVRGEPMVATPYHAYRCFINTEMDICVINNFYLEKNRQRPREIDDEYIHQLKLD